MEISYAIIYFHNKWGFSSMAYLYLSQVSLLPLLFKVTTFVMKSKNPFAHSPHKEKAK